MLIIQAVFGAGKDLKRNRAVIPRFLYGAQHQVPVDVAFSYCQVFIILPMIAAYMHMSQTFRQPSQYLWCPVLWNICVRYVQMEQDARHFPEDLLQDNWIAEKARSILCHHFQFVFPSY